MTTLQSTCASLARANATLIHGFHEHINMRATPGFYTSAYRMEHAFRVDAAMRHIETTRFIGPDFAAANDNTMVVGVA